VDKVVIETCLLEIVNAQGVVIAAVRHQREDDYH
jgi:hypothetical protein